MHREVLRARRGQTVDHANGDKLDNQRHNLRACSVAENLWNARPRRNGYKGVSSDERGWRACLAANGEVYRTKRFGTEGEAARAYDALARLHHGRFARLNFPEPQP